MKVGNKLEVGKTYYSVGFNMRCQHVPMKITCISVDGNTSIIQSRKIQMVAESYSEYFQTWKEGIE